MQRALCISSHAVAAEYGSKALLTRESALDAVLAGFFAAAALEPGVLFGPLALLTGGTGEGARAYDGRCRQPGVLGKRPRGFLPTQALPQAARVAVPTGIAALAISTSYYGEVSWASACRPAVSLAKQEGALGRAELLAQVSGLAARTLAEGSLARAWTSQYGPVGQGQVTSGDLRAPAGLDQPALEVGDTLCLPFDANIDGGAKAQGGTAHAIVAVDARGLFVGLEFTVLDGGAELTGYEVTVPLLAVPVLRGVPRVAPGTPLGTLPPLRLVREAGAITRVEAELGVGRAPLSLYRHRETREVSRLG
jgi:hypothetical protein